MSVSISSHNRLGTATSANWKMIEHACSTSFALNLISFTHSVTNFCFGSNSEVSDGHENVAFRG